MKHSWILLGAIVVAVAAWVGRGVINPSPPPPQPAGEAGSTDGAQVIESAAASEAVEAFSPSKTYEEALEDFRKITGQEPNDRNKLKLQMLHLELTEAIAIFDRQEYGHNRKVAGIELAIRLAKENPELGLKWLISLENEPANQPFFEFFASSLGSSDPRKAEEMVSDIPVGAFRATYLQAMIRGIAGTDPQAALEKLDQLSAMLEETGLKRESALAGIIQSSAYTGKASPQLLFNLLDSIESDALKKVATEQILTSLLKSNVEAATQWIGGLSEGAYKETAVFTLVWAWYVKDSLAASSWLRDQPAGPSRDKGIVALMDRAEPYAPAEALEWTQSLSDQKLRMSEAVVRFIKFCNFDATRAREVVNNMTIPDDEKASILSHWKK